MKSVLIFDSGVGGLSVFQEIAKAMPNQHIVYAFDNEAFPYGELADDLLISRVCGMIAGICKQQEISLVVIACNTASTLVLPPLRNLLSVPVVGVVPAIKPAALKSQTKKIALLATPATIRRPYTHDLISEFAAHCDVKLIGSTTLVHMAEAKLRGVKPDLNQLKEILSPLIGTIDGLVLGCTHFPLLREEIKAILGADCDIIDSGKAIADRVQYLQKGQREIKSALLPLHQVMSSTLVQQEKELNQSLAKLGFSHIIRCPAF